MPLCTLLESTENNTNNITTNITTITNNIKKDLAKEGITRGLIIKDPWMTLILNNEKTLEMRSTNTKIRGPIALIKSGSGLIVGKAILKDVINFKTLESHLPDWYSFHKIDYKDNPEYKKYCYGWILSDVEEYIIPIPYKHPQGAVIWVKL